MDAWTAYYDNIDSSEYQGVRVSLDNLEIPYRCEGGCCDGVVVVTEWLL